MENYDLETRVPRTFGLDGMLLKFEKKIGMLSTQRTRGIVIIGYKKKGEADLADWKEYGKLHGFELVELIWGGSLIKGGKTKFLSTPLFADRRNPNRFGFVYEERTGDVFYSALRYTQE